MTLPSRASAEAIFGSASRGQTDSLSDRDILIVDDETALLRERANELESEGWSVAPYTFAKLRALSRRGALFLQHLKQEAQIVCDDGRLSELLQQFKPLRDYSGDLDSNSELAQLASLIPNRPRGRLFAADILYVSLRNFGVLWLAQRQRYLFAYDSILDSLLEERLLTSDAVQSLRSLRFLKCLYRSGEDHAGESVLSAVQLAMAHLPSDYFPTSSIVATPQMVLQQAWPKVGAPPYLILRDFERRLLAAESSGVTKTRSDLLAKVSTWIANPRAYASLSAAIAPEIRLELERCFDAVRANIA